MAETTKAMQTGGVIMAIIQTQSIQCTRGQMLRHYCLRIERHCALIFVMPVMVDFYLLLSIYFFIPVEEHYNLQTDVRSAASRLYL